MFLLCARIFSVRFCGLQAVLETFCMSSSALFVQAACFCHTVYFLQTLLPSHAFLIVQLLQYKPETPHQLASQYPHMNLYGRPSPRYRHEVCANEKHFQSAASLVIVPAFNLGETFWERHGKHCWGDCVTAPSSSTSTSMACVHLVPSNTG